jgi:hypothetical protein
MERTREAGLRQHKPRILHAPANVAGIAGLLARAQREQGFDATAVEYFQRPFDFGVDRSLGLRPTDSPLKKAALMGTFALAALRRYDVFHLYFGNTLLPHPYPDLPVLRALARSPAPWASALSSIFVAVTYASGNIHSAIIRSARVRTVFGTVAST